MNKVMVAVAFAAGVVSFAAHAQEAPGNPYTTETAAVVTSVAKSSDRKVKETKGKASASVERGRFSVAVPEVAAKRSAGRKKGRTAISLDGVDPQKTASISPEKSVAPAAKSSKDASGSFGDIIARHASANGVPVSLAKAVVRVESNFRANARGRAGEVGLMQIKPSTARGLGYSGSTKALYDPETNIKWGMKYLGMAHKLGGGSTCGTILKYNAGHGAKRMNPVSAAYCSKVKRHLSS